MFPTDVVFGLMIVPNPLLLRVSQYWLTTRTSAPDRPKADNDEMSALDDGCGGLSGL